jgi:hypothetical protein
MNQPADHERFEQLFGIARTIKTSASTLSDQFDKHLKLIGFKRAFLKMDTQGSDLAVARGAGDRLQRFVGIQSGLSF